MGDDFEYTMTDADRAISIFIGVMFVIITCFGVPVNILAIKVLKKNSSHQLKLIEQIPISMCASNLIQLFPLYLILSISAFKQKWVFGFPFCQFSGFWVHFHSNASIWHLVAYAMEQRRAVGSERSVTAAWNNMNKWKKYLVVSLVWLHGLFWSIIPFSGWCGYAFEGLGLSCSVTWESRDNGSLSYTISILLFNFLIPIVIIANCYLKIFSHFKNHIVNLSLPLDSSIQARNRVKLRKLAVVGSFMTGSFLFAWAPYAAVGLYMIFTQQRAPAMLVTLPAVFAKCSVVIYPLVIILKRSAFKLRFGNTSQSRQIVTRTVEQQTNAPAN